MMRAVWTVFFGFTIALAIGSTSAIAFDIVNRWTATQFDGGGIQRGDPVTLYWSIVPDGESYERSDNSDLIEFLDDGWNVAPVNRTPALNNRPWWDVIKSAYDQYTQVSGIRMLYHAEQDPSGLDTGNEGDIRIGGEAFDTNPEVNVLADNTFPNSGDMRIDTTPDGFFNSTNEAGFRNLISHESGHGVGLGHSEISGADAVMEGGIQSHFYGLQFDDVYAFNRLYGDPQEKNGGNDTLATSFNLGNFTANALVSYGTDAVDSVVEESDDDWLSIDGATDEDWFRFEVPGTSVVDIKVSPIGPTYQTAGETFQASSQSDLQFQVYKPDGSLFQTVASKGLGVAEHLDSQTLFEPGEYYVRVAGNEDANQFYQIDVDVDLPDLILTVDRSTGEMRMSGIGEGIAIDGYRIESVSGSLDPGDGAWLSLADQGSLEWREANPTDSSIQELLPAGTLHLDDSDSIYLGEFYSQILTAPFGIVEHGDVTFSYLAPGSGDEWLSGAVEFVGSPFDNNLVLTIDPGTGEAILVNESGTAIQLDGYSISSDSASLDPDGWSSLEDQMMQDWRESNPGQDRLSELKPTGGLTILPGEMLDLGQLFDVSGIQDVELSFLFNGDAEFRDGIVNFVIPGDYDRDGDVDADDYLRWKQTFGSTEHLTADGNRDGVVNLADYTVWRDHLSASLGSSTVGASIVPEPASNVLAVIALGALGAAVHFSAVAKTASLQFHS